MTSHTALSALQSVVFAATTKKSSSGSPVFFIVLILLLAVYLLWLRPKRNQLRAQQAQANAPEVGDEVLTTGGLIGRVIRFEADRAVVEVAPGQQLTFLRSALVRRIEPVVPDTVDDIPDYGSPNPQDEHVEEGEQDGDDSPRRWWPGSKGDDDSPDAGGTN